MSDEAKAGTRLSALAIFGSLLSTLDATIVNVSLSSIATELHVSVADVAWVVTGYLLAMALSLPLSGWLVERFGARSVYLTTLAGFAAASVLCGLAGTFPLLVLFRVLQGAVAGVTAPMGQTIVGQLVGRDRLGRVMGTVSTVTSLGGLLGPVVGGAIVANASWRWVFFVNVPIGIVGLILAARGLPPMPPDTSRRHGLDVPGLLMLSAGLAGVTYGLTDAGSHGLHPLNAGAAAVGAALVTWFVFRSKRDPTRAVLDVGLCRVRSFTVGAALSFLTRFASDGGLILLSLYLIHARGIDPALAGLILAPNALGSLVAVSLAGRWNDTRGPRLTATIGAVLALLVGVALALLTNTTPVWFLIIVFFARGVSASLGGLPPVAAAYRDVDRTAAPQTTTTLNVATRIGSPAGTAVATILLAIVATSERDATAYATTFAWLLVPLVVALVLSTRLPHKMSPRSSR